MLHVHWVQFHSLIFCLNIAKLCAVLISSLRLFQSRLPLNFNELLLNLRVLAGVISQSCLILRLYSTHFWWRNPTYTEDSSSWSSYIFPPLVFANFSCELSKFHLFARVPQAPRRHCYTLFSLHVWLFYLLHYLLFYYKATTSKDNFGN